MEDKKEICLMDEQEDKEVLVEPDKGEWLVIRGALMFREVPRRSRERTFSTGDAPSKAKFVL